MNTNIIELATANKEISVSVDLDYEPRTFAVAGEEKLQCVILSAVVHTPGSRLRADVTVHAAVTFVADADSVHPCVEFVNKAIAEYAKLCKELSWKDRVTMSRREHCNTLHRLLLKQIAEQSGRVANFLTLENSTQVCDVQR